MTHICHKSLPVCLLVCLFANCLQFLCFFVCLLAGSLASVIVFAPTCHHRRFTQTNSSASLRLQPARGPRSPFGPEGLPWGQRRPGVAVLLRPKRLRTTPPFTHHPPPRKDQRLQNPWPTKTGVFEEVGIRWARPPFAFPSSCGSSSKIGPTLRVNPLWANWVVQTGESQILIRDP